MSDKLRCEIVQDLLPSYVDGLTSDETNEAIKDHLADCVSCRDMYERMKADEMSAEENSAVMEKEKKEINFLKKIKQKHRLNLMLVVVILTVFFAAVLSISEYDKAIGDTVPDICPDGCKAEGSTAFLSDWDAAETFCRLAGAGD